MIVRSRDATADQAKIVIHATNEQKKLEWSAIRSLFSRIAVPLSALDIKDAAPTLLYILFATKSPSQQGQSLFSESNPRDVRSICLIPTRREHFTIFIFVPKVHVNKSLLWHQLGWKMTRAASWYIFMHRGRILLLRSIVDPSKFSKSH